MPSSVLCDTILPARILAVLEGSSVLENTHAFRPSAPEEICGRRFARFVVRRESDRANRSLSAMCDEQDALLDNFYPLTLDRSAMHSLVGCRGEQCQLQTFCRERWIY
jgi:hypothetical protein